MEVEKKRVFKELVNVDATNIRNGCTNGILQNGDTVCGKSADGIMAIRGGGMRR